MYSNNVLRIGIRGIRVSEESLEGFIQKNRTDQYTERDKKKKDG